jgi:hypothetical protein
MSESNEVNVKNHLFFSGLSKSDKIGLSSMLGGSAAFIMAGIVMAASVGPVAPNADGGFVINIAGGNDNATAEADGLSADAKMWYGWNNVFVPSESLPKDDSVGAVYEFVSIDVKTMLLRAANAMNVEGQMYSKTYDYGDGYSSTEHWWGFTDENGAVDYTRPYVSAYSSDQQPATSWSYSMGYEPVVYSEPYEGEGSVGSSPNGTTEIMPAPDMMPVPEEEYNVPQYDETAALQEVSAILSGLGYSTNDFNIYSDTSWGTMVTAELMLDGEVTPISFSFNFGTNGLEYASGYAGDFVKRGDFSVVSPYSAVERINSNGYSSWAAASLYEKYYAVYDDLARIKPLDAPVSSEDIMIDDSETFIVDDNMETMPLEEAERTEAFGVIVTYRDGEEPTVNDSGVIVGFENIAGSESFILGAELFDNMWSVSFNGNKTAEETNQIIAELEASGVFESVSGDWVVNIMPDEGYNPEPVEVTISKYEKVWTILYDTSGKMFLIKGYIFSDDSGEYGSYTVSAVSSDVVNIVEPDYGLQPMPEPYMNK